MIYKVVARFRASPELPSYMKAGKVGRQVKKTIYTSKLDYDKYSPELIKRWSKYWDVFVYQSQDGVEWEVTSNV